jgi:hypothetical protein
MVLLDQTTELRTITCLFICIHRVPQLSELSIDYLFIYLDQNSDFHSYHKFKRNHNLSSQSSSTILTSGFSCVG